MGYLIVTMSKITKRIIIGDVHHEIPWVESILKREDFSPEQHRITFTGDFFDLKNKVETAAVSMHDVVKALVRYSKFSDIIAGNHDLFYAEEIYASRYEHKNSEPRDTYNRSLSIYGNEYKWAYELENLFNKENTSFKALFPNLHKVHFWGGQPLLATHAGLHQHYTNVPNDDKNINYISEISASIQKVYEEAYFDSFRVPNPLMTGCGYVRRGKDVYGGVVWRDAFKEPSNLPVHQIFGHSATDNKIYVQKTKSGHNHILIDSTQSTYAVLEDDKLIFRSNNRVTGEPIPFSLIKIDAENEAKVFVDNWECVLYPSGHVTNMVKA